MHLIENNYLSKLNIIKTKSLSKKKATMNQLNAQIFLKKRYFIKSFKFGGSYFTQKQIFFKFYFLMNKNVESMI